ncbi:MAG TPA: ATP-binding protein [Acidimicrobiales bacterium]|nr:ATP-binding protein [Acidimicrobiales bacterium]
MTSVFDDVVGQESAVAHLRAAVVAPVHAYLLVGPPGSGKRTSATAFAAALLCPNGGCGTCDVCRRALAGVHPDVVVVERSGPSITVEQAREVRRLALRSPNEGSRKVLILTDFHLVREAASVLLKVLEEPPASTVFVILAEQMPPELVTIASRCVRVDFGPLSSEQIAAALLAEGVPADVASSVAGVAGGRLDRARLLANDPGVADRRDAWRSVPARLDGTGATVAVVVSDLAELLGAAGVAALEARQAAERAELEERVERTGERGAGRKVLADRHKRELRRLRHDELRFGLAGLAAVYGEALASGAADARACIEAVAAIQAAAEAMVRNPTEALLLQDLLLGLPPLRDRRAILDSPPG